MQRTRKTAMIGGSFMWKYSVIFAVMMVCHPVTLQSGELAGQSGGTNKLFSVRLSTVMAPPPKIDGKLDDACWQGAARVNLVDYMTGQKPKAATEAYITHDEHALYIGFVCQEPEIGKLRTEVTQRDGRTWTDDCVEVFVAPGLSRRSYYHFVVTARGIQADGCRDDFKWDGRWESKTSVETNKWIVEMALPFYNFPPEGDWGQDFGINLCRERKVEPENSAWSPTFGGFHNPGRFGVIHDLAIDNAAYPAVVTAPKLAYETGNDGYLEIALYQDVTNRLERNVSLKVSVADETAFVELGKGGSKTIRVPVMDMTKRGEVYRVCQEVRNATTDQRVFFAGRSVDVPKLLRVWLDRSWYTSETKARVRGRMNMELSELAIKAGLVDGTGREITEKKIQLTGKEFSEEFKIKALSPGEYGVILSLAQRGRVIYSERIPLVKYPSSIYEVKVDQDMRLPLVEERPFFAIGLIDIPMHLIEDYRTAGFNISRGYAVDNYLDTACYHGMKVTIPAYYVISRDDYKKPPEETEKLIRNSALKDTASHAKNHPAFMNYFWDEPAEEEKKGVSVLSKITREYDPYHPVSPCFYQCSGPTLSSDVYDIDTADIYWDGGPDHVAFPMILLSGIENHARISETFRKPFWFMPEAAGYSRRTAITPEQQRFQTWLGIIHGAKGIYYWTYENTFPAMRTMLKQLAGELRELTPVLITPNPCQTASGTNAAGIHLLAKICRNHLYLITANNSGDNRAIAEFGVIGLDRKGKVDVLFENRSIAVEAGRFADVFEPYGVHVYRLADAIGRIQEPLNLVVKTIANEAVVKPKSRLWPDFETRSIELPNGGFEETEDGQARIWYPSCSWESPGYCSVDTKEAHQGNNSLRIHIPDPTLFSESTSYGWMKPGVSAFDLGGPNDLLRDGHQVSKGVFKTAITNGTYELIAVMRNPRDVGELDAGKVQRLEWEEREIPEIQERFPAHTNRIRKYRCEARIADGSLDLAMESACLFGLTVRPVKWGGDSLKFDFGTENSPTARGYTKVAAPLFTAISVRSTNGDSTPRLKLMQGKEYVLSLYAKADRADFSLSIAMTLWGKTIPSTVKTEYAKIGRQWQEYRMRFVPAADLDGQLTINCVSSGTVWIDDVTIRLLSSPDADTKK